ncbi:hypothetical protein C8J57DRAFT_1513028 [Mycena rebaudengoi]|nr:hypothetical protein C8J57DRAFT_1513028 [Mycena rebaudengoi]
MSSARASWASSYRICDSTSSILVKTISSCLLRGWSLGVNKRPVQAQHKANVSCVFSIGGTSCASSDGGPLPAVSRHLSYPSMERVREQIIEEMKTPTTKPDARAAA